MWWKHKPYPGPKRQINKERGGGKKKEDGGEKKGGRLTPSYFLSFLLSIFAFNVSRFRLPLSLSPSSSPSSLDSLSVTADLFDTVFLKLSPVWKQKINGNVFSVGLGRSHSFTHTWGGLTYRGVMRHYTTASRGIVHPKIKIHSLSSHPPCRWKVGWSLFTFHTSGDQWASGDSRLRSIKYLNPSIHQIFK